MDYREGLPCALPCHAPRCALPRPPLSPTNNKPKRTAATVHTRPGRTWALGLVRILSVYCPDR